MFRDIFVVYPVLRSSCPTRHSLNFNPLLLVWLRRHSSYINMLASDGLWLDMALTSLAKSVPPLNKFKAHTHARITMAALPVFTSLQFCDLVAPCTNPRTPLDLLPLQALPASQHLSLQEGHFCNLYSASGLTNLFMKDRAVLSQQGCTAMAGSVRRLCTISSKVDDLHSLGVCACTALDLLEFSNLMIWLR